MEKHAILLLANKGLFYIDKFCEQFENNENFNIYIHFDAKNSNDKINEHIIENYKKKYKNIKGFIYNAAECYYYNFGLVVATLKIIRMAIKDPENYMFHLMSEQCRQIQGLIGFYKFFKKDHSYITWNNKKNFYRIILHHNLAGSQWWSLCRKDIEYILEKDKIYNSKYNTGHYDLGNGAYDEVYFQNLLISEKIKNNESIDHIVNNNYRFLHWRRNPNHPDVLNVDDKEYYKYYYNFDSKNYAIIRKIDVMQIGSLKFWKSVLSNSKNNIINKYINK